MDLFKKLVDWKVILVCTFNGVLFRFRKWLGWKVCDAVAIQSLYDTLDPTKVTYSQVWEDSKTLRQALALGPSDKTICVSSGGDNALALLLDNPELILAVDFSAAQVAVGELKRQAIKQLPYGVYLYFLGVQSGKSSGYTRFGIYSSLLRHHLPPKQVQFWDDNLDLIDGGLIHAGLYSKYFRTFGKTVRPVVHSLDTLKTFFSKTDIDSQRSMYVDVIDTWLWRFLNKLYFGDVLVGRCPAFYERSDVNVGRHFLSRLRHVMCNVSANNNHYLEYVLTGEISGNFGLPEYMEEKNFDTLKQRADNLVFVEGEILQILEKSESHFDAIDLSNIFDFVPLTSHGRYKKAVMQRAAAGCRVCHWIFVPVSEQRLDTAPFGFDSGMDAPLSKELNDTERAWFYQKFFIQRIGQKSKTDAVRQRNGFAHSKNGTHKNGFISAVQAQAQAAACS